MLTPSDLGVMALQSGCVPSVVDAHKCCRHFSTNFKRHVINHEGNCLGTFLDTFWINKRNILERDLNLRLPDWSYNVFLINLDKQRQID